MDLSRVCYFTDAADTNVLVETLSLNEACMCTHLRWRVWALIFVAVETTEQGPGHSNPHVLNESRVFIVWINTLEHVHNAIHSFISSSRNTSRL